MRQHHRRKNPVKSTSWLIFFLTFAAIIVFTSVVQQHVFSGTDIYEDSLHYYKISLLNGGGKPSTDYYHDNVDDGQFAEEFDNAVEEYELTAKTQPTKSSPALIHWNATDRKSLPTVYFCHPNNNNGMREIKRLMETIVPEYRHRSLHIKSEQNPLMSHMPKELLERDYTNEYDIFVGHFESYCQSVVERWLGTFFNGHSIYFSGESVEFHPIQGKHASNRLHAFGPVKDDTIRDEDMVLYYCQLTYLFYLKDALPPNVLISAADRPKGNTTKTFMIYANSNCVPFREEAVGLLSQIGLVHCDGRCQGSTPPNGNRTNLVKSKYGPSVHSWWTNVKHYSNYKFCFVMEHTADHTGYITEKILLAFAGGCIPIYYGTERIFDIFNRKAFVFYNISEPEKALDFVRKLNDEEKLYEEMLNEPIAAKGEETVKEYFSFTDTVGNGELKRTMRAKLGLSNLVP